MTLFVSAKLVISRPRSMELRCTLKKLLDKMPIDHTIYLVTRLACILQTIKPKSVKMKNVTTQQIETGDFLKTFQDHDISKN